MAIRKSSIAVAAFALLAASACMATETYRVSASLSHNGKSFGQPIAVVRADTPASVEVSGPDGYKLGLVVTDIAKDQIKVAATIDSSHGNIAPAVVVHPGQPATVKVGELELTLTVNRTGS